MKFLQILIIVFVGFVFEANAQLCGRYTTTLKVVNEDGQPIKNTKIQISPLQEKDYTRGNNFVPEKGDASRFYISFNEGHEVSGKYKVVVTAPGFSPAEKEFTFPHCARRIFEVVLKPKGAAESVSDFRDIIKINGEIFSGKDRLGLVELTATNGTGRIFKTKADKDGHYSLELPLGDYTFLYQKAGYKTVKITNVGIKEKRNIYLYSVELESSATDKKDNIVVKDYKDLYKSIDVY